MSTTKIYFNQKDLLQNPALELCSFEARWFFAYLAAFSCGCEKPGHLMRGGQPLGLQAIANAMRCPVDRAGALISELTDCGLLVLSKAGVLVVGMVEKAAARSLKAARAARERFNKGQYHLFEKQQKKAGVKGGAENNVTPMTCGKKRRRKSPPLYPPKNQKNIFYSFSEIPASKIECERQNREEITDPARKWAFIGNVVKVREGEIAGLMERFAAPRGEIVALLERHEEFCGDPARLPDSQVDNWRFMLVGFCRTHFAIQRAANKAGGQQRAAG